MALATPAVCAYCMTTSLSPVSRKTKAVDLIKLLIKVINRGSRFMRQFMDTGLLPSLQVSIYQYAHFKQIHYLKQEIVQLRNEWAAAMTRYIYSLFTGMLHAMLTWIDSRHMPLRCIWLQRDAVLYKLLVICHKMPPPRKIAVIRGGHLVPIDAMKI